MEVVEVVVMVVRVAATLLVVYGGVLCLGHQLLARHARLIAELELSLI